MVSHTLSKSNGWVTHAAPAEATPPRYHLCPLLLGAISSIAASDQRRSLFLTDHHLVTLYATGRKSLTTIANNKRSKVQPWNVSGDIVFVYDHHFPGHLIIDLEVKVRTRGVSESQLEREGCAMAEVVHRNLETMLPQLEALENSGIFSHDEIRFRNQHCHVF